MKKFLIVLALLLAGITGQQVTSAYAYNFGDYRSVTLTTKAWEALQQGDLEAVLAYTNKCIELYAQQAKKMQSSLTAYPTGTNQEIFGYWALNDVATSYFIQGEAYRKANMKDESKEAFQKLIDEYTYGQAWEPKGWFWKPAEAAQEKLALIESGSNIDFGDSSSEQLTTKAWEALKNNNLDDVLTYTNKCINQYGAKAKEMQNSLTEYPFGEKDKIFAYWALNDVGTCLFIQGEAYRNAGKTDEAKAAYKKLIDEYFYAQCWDPQGWFWKPAEAAQQKLDELASGGGQPDQKQTTEKSADKSTDKATESSSSDSSSSSSSSDKSSDKSSETK